MIDCWSGSTLTKERPITKRLEECSFSGRGQFRCHRSEVCGQQKAGVFIYPFATHSSFQGLTRSWTCILLVLSLKLFPLIETGLTLYGTFLAFALVLVCFFPVIFFILPETKENNNNLMICCLIDWRIFIFIFYLLLSYLIDLSVSLTVWLTNWLIFLARLPKIYMFAWDWPDCWLYKTLLWVQGLSLDVIQQYFRSNSVIEDDVEAKTTMEPDQTWS